MFFVWICQLFYVFYHIRNAARCVSELFPFSHTPPFLFSHTPCSTQQGGANRDIYIYTSFYKRICIANKDMYKKKTQKQRIYAIDKQNYIYTKEKVKDQKGSKAVLVALASSHHQHGFSLSALLFFMHVTCLLCIYRVLSFFIQSYYMHISWKKLWIVSIAICPLTE